MSEDPIIEGQADISAEPATPDVSATEQTVPDGDTQSVLAQVRELRNSLGSGAKPLDIDIPGYKGLLVIRNKWVPFKTLSKSAKGLQNIAELSEQQVAAAADLMVLTCQEILIRVGEELRPLSTTDNPITFSDPRLSEALNFPVQRTARDTVREAFKNEYALLRVSNTVVEWLQDTSVQVDEDALGN